MSTTKRLRGPCSHCGVDIEYPAELIGTMRQCPYCRKETELVLATPPQASAVPARIIVFTIIAVAILLGGLIGSFYALRKTQSLVREHQKAPPAVQTNAPPAP